MKRQEWADFGRSLMQVRRAVSAVEGALIRQHFGSFKATPGDARMLLSIAKIGEQGSQEIAKDLGVSQPAASVAIARLAKAGMVKHKPAGNTDRRRKVVALTSKGKDAVEAAEAYYIDVAKVFAKPFSTAEQSVFAEMFVKSVGFTVEATSVEGALRGAMED
jgi:DNA-binding MarR family transcriptional regulator